MKDLTLLFLVRDGQVLLAMKKRGFGAGRWNGVGGKLENGETVEQALVRECQEEIGVIPVNFVKAAEITFKEFSDGVEQLMSVHVYTCNEWQGDPAETEEMAPQWFSISEIPYDDMWPDDPYWLPQVLEGKRITAEFKLDQQDKILEMEVREI